MEYAADKHSLFVNPIEDYVFRVLEPTVAWPNTIACAAEARGLGQSPKAGIQVIEVAIRLFLSPGLESVVRNAEEIGAG